MAATRNDHASVEVFREFAWNIVGVLSHSKSTATPAKKPVRKRTRKPLATPAAKPTRSRTKRSAK